MPFWCNGSRLDPTKRNSIALDDDAVNLLLGLPPRVFEGFSKVITHREATLLFAMAARRGDTDSQIAMRFAKASLTSLILTIFTIQVLASSPRRKRTKTRAGTLSTRKRSEAQRFKLPSRSYPGSPLTPLQQLWEPSQQMTGGGLWRTWQTGRSC